MEKIYSFLRWSQKYTGTDMVYLVKGDFWLGLGTSVIAISGFLLTIVLANLLTRENFGTFKYVLAIANLLNIFTLPGIYVALVRSIAKGYEGSFIPGLKTQIRWGIVGAIGCLILSGYYFLNGNLILTISFLIVAFSLPFTQPFNIFNAFWQGKKRFDIQNQYLISSHLLSLAVIILTLFLTNNLFAVLVAWFGSHTLFRFIFLRLTYKKISNQKQQPETISYGKHLSIMEVPQILGSQLDKILLWYFLGPVSVAIYSVALAPIDHLRQLISIGPLALPKFSEKTKEEIKGTLLKKISKYFLVTILLGLIYIFIAPYIFRFLFPAYLESIPYSQWLGLILMSVPLGLIGTSLISQMKKKELYVIKFSIPLIRIALFLILIPLYGIGGAITAILISHVVGGGLSLFLFRRM